MSWSGFISDDADDGDWVPATSTFLPLGSVTCGNAAGNSVHAWYRFVSVGVANGEAIFAAQIARYLIGTARGTLRIYAAAEDNAASPLSVADAEGRALTTAYADYSLDTVGPAYFDTSDLAAVVQEIVDRPGWSAGNAILFLFRDNGSAVNNISASQSFGGNAAELTINTDFPSESSSGSSASLSSSSSDGLSSSSAGVSSSSSLSSLSSSALSSSNPLGLDCAWTLVEAWLTTGRLAALAEILADGESLIRADGELYLEPAAIQSLSQCALHAVNLANLDRTRASPQIACGEEVPDRGVLINSQCLTGRLPWKPGYNVTLQQNDQDNSLTIGAGVGAGAGEPCEEIPLNDDDTAPDGSDLLTGGPRCSEVITSINGVSGQHIQFVAATGFKITPSEDDPHELIIEVDLHGLAVCPES